MQIGSSVSNRYYTSYQTNKSVKYCAGFTKTENGKMTPNETTKNPGFAKFVNYQEFHKAWMYQGAETAFSYTGNNGFNEDTAIDFARFAPNAPEEVRKAFSEAADKTGYYEYSDKRKDADDGYSDYRL